jgi:carbonic anhydrase
MESLAFIQSFIGIERTLVISCIECCLDVEHNHSTGDIFQYTVLGNVLNPADKLQAESILSFVQFKRCSKIIIAGHYDCKAINYLLNGLPDESPIGNLQDFLLELYEVNHGNLLDEKMVNRMLVEMNVLHQCKSLERTPVIRELVDNRKLTIIGLIIDPTGNHKQVFSNGLGYNDFVSMN